MESSASYVHKILTPHTTAGRGHSSTYLIIRRPYAHLEAELRRISNVTVIVDRRAGARRKIDAPTETERRHAERRRLNEELGEMVVVIDGT